MKLTTKEIMEIIPHRHPFLLIDTRTDHPGTEYHPGCYANDIYLSHL